MKSFDLTRESAHPRPSKTQRPGAGTPSTLVPIVQQAIALQQSAGNRATASVLSGVLNGGESAGSSGFVPPAIRDQIERHQGSGAPIPDDLRRDFEMRCRADFGEVRIHVDDESQRLAQSVGAKAFTSGNDIFFSAGAFRPESSQGRELLRHELGHVLQQRDGAGAAAASSAREYDRLERAASADAHQRSAGSTKRPSLSVGSAVAVQRALPDEVGEAAGGAGFLGDLYEAYKLVGEAGAGLKSLGGITSALGLVTGTMDMMDEEKSGVDRTVGGMSAFGGATGLLGLLAPSTFAAGGSAGLGATAGTGFGVIGSGGLGAGSAVALASLGKVAAAGAAGYGAGRLLDKGFGLGAEFLGLGRGLDALEGVSRPEGQSRDVSISGLLGDSMLQMDRGISSLWRDESKPAYTQTLGWKLAEALPSWLQ